METGCRYDPLVFLRENPVGFASHMAQQDTDRGVILQLAADLTGMASDAQSLIIQNQWIHSHLNPC